MKKLFLASLFVLTFVSANVFAQMPAKTDAPLTPNTPENKELIGRLLEANGVRVSLIKIFEDIINRAPADQQKELRDLLKPDAIIDNIIPVYAKYFTPDEMKELIAFYKSPIGVKNLNLTSQLMNEVMQVSGKYFEDNVKKLEKPAIPAAGATPGAGAIPAKAAPVKK